MMKLIIRKKKNNNNDNILSNIDGINTKKIHELKLINDDEKKSNTYELNEKVDIDLDTKKHQNSQEKNTNHISHTEPRSIENKEIKVDCNIESLSDKDKRTYDLSSPIEKKNSGISATDKHKKKNKSAGVLKLNALWYVIMFKSRFNLAAIRYKIRRRSRGNFLNRACFDIIGSVWYLYSTTFIIIFNTIVLSMDRYPISYEEDHIFDILNLVFTALLGFEMILKLIGKS